MAGFGGIGELNGLVGENICCAGGSVVAGAAEVVAGAAAVVEGAAEVVAGAGEVVVFDCDSGPVVTARNVVVVGGTVSLWPLSGPAVMVAHAVVKTATSNAIAMAELGLVLSRRCRIGDPGVSCGFTHRIESKPRVA